MRRTGAGARTAARAIGTTASRCFGRPRPATGTSWSGAWRPSCGARSERHSASHSARLADSQVAAAIADLRTAEEQALLLDDQDQLRAIGHLAAHAPGDRSEHARFGIRRDTQVFERPALH